MAYVPEDYIPITEAGRGITSRVYYCVSKRAVNLVTETGPLTPTSIGFDGLKRSIVAVKVSPMKVLITQEVSALRAIQQSSSPNTAAMKRHFLSSTATGSFGLLGSTYSYVTLSAITPPVTLGDLLGVCSGETKAPIPLVYHFFLSLVPAVLFLRDEVQLAHNDIKEDNIMCRLYEGCPYGLPEFVLVDFGMSYDICAIKNDSGDCKKVLTLVREFFDKAVDSRDMQWLGFKCMLAGERHRNRWQVDGEIEKIWRTWEDLAVEARGERKVWEVDRAEDMFQSAVGKKERITDELFVSAVHG